MNIYSALLYFCILMGASLACEAATCSTPWSSLQVVPGNLNQNTEGNDSTLVPFGSFGFPNFEDCGSVRYQQVITAGEFHASPQPLRYIWSMMFMIDPCNKEASTLMNLGIRFSTTERGADELSTKFAENIGPDQLEVYRVEGRGFGDVGSCSGKPFPVDGRNWYIFDKAFPYSAANAPVEKSELLNNCALKIEIPPPEEPTLEK